MKYCHGCSENLPLWYRQMASTASLKRDTICGGTELYFIKLKAGKEIEIYRGWLPLLVAWCPEHKTLSRDQDGNREFQLIFWIPEDGSG